MRYFPKISFLAAFFYSFLFTYSSVSTFWFFCFLCFYNYCWYIFIWKKSQTSSPAAVGLFRRKILNNDSILFTDIIILCLRQYSHIYPNYIMNQIPKLFTLTHCFFIRTLFSKSFYFFIINICFGRFIYPNITKYISLRMFFNQLVILIFNNFPIFSISSFSSFIFFNDNTFTGYSSYLLSFSTI